ncbi:integral membrane protein [Anaeramoeba ignava]|uniref:Integral membrane protein n=1 Tax=Anaeramoeba ignava TaxID=1746090 RepID=A0A9Q0LAJ5_ANAIG|nr:integral membrane protein [Anaeramoeba ignava]
MSETFSALKNQKWELYVISFLFLIIFFWCLYEIFANFKFLQMKIERTQKLTRYRVIIFIITGAFSFLRFLIFFFNIPLSNSFTLPFFYFAFPLYLQFCIFGIFVLLLSSVTFRFQKKKQYHKWIQISIITILTLALLSQIITCAIFENYTDEKFAWIGIVYGFLAVLIPIISFRFLAIIQEFQRSHTNKTSLRIKLVFALIGTYSLIFLIRAIWDILTLAQKNTLNDKIIDEENKTKDSFFVSFLFWYLFFEILPCVILGITLHINVKKETRMINQQLFDAEMFFLLSPHPKNIPQQPQENTVSDYSDSDLKLLNNTQVPRFKDSSRGIGDLRYSFNLLWKESQNLDLSDQDDV